MPGIAGPPTVPPYVPLEVDESGGRTRRPKPPLIARDSVFALVALAAALFIAYQLDAFISFLRLRSVQTFEMLPILWVPALSNFVLGGALLLLGWWLARKAGRRPWIGLAYVIAGVAAVVYVPLIFTFGLGQLGFRLPAAGFPRGYLSYWTVSGTALAMMGALHILLRQTPANS